MSKMSTLLFNKGVRKIEVKRKLLFSENYTIYPSNEGALFFYPELDFPMTTFSSAIRE